MAITTATEEQLSPRPPGKLKAFAIEVGDIGYFMVSSVKALPGTTQFVSESLRQTAILIRGSTAIIFALVTYIGITQVNFAYFFLKSAGAEDYTGLFSGLTTARAAVPIMFGYIFAAKVGGGIAAEIGAMRISQEIDALEAEAVNPMSYLVGTRIVGGIIFAPIAAVVALLAGTFGSWLEVGPVLHGIPIGSFWQYHWGAQSLSDQYLSILNLSVQAVVIVTVASYYGYKAKGGPSGVGSAVARSLLVNIVLVHVITAMYILVFYGQNSNLPIGG
ncbi:MAG: MlaE family ABC transporter permease [Solirubrobacteraceae bacterium]